MKIGSIKEDMAYEKRVSITPESAKNLIGLGLEICIEKNYATHLGIQDKDFENLEQIQRILKYLDKGKLDQAAWPNALELNESLNSFPSVPPSAASTPSQYAFS